MFSLLFITIASVWAQGVTTATITGRVLGAKGSNPDVKTTSGEALPGATVIAVHTPSGTRYGTLATSDGHFTIPNARIGGPYKVTVSFVGYQTQDKDEIYLSLGNVADVNFTLTEEGVQLQEVIVSAAKGDLFNSERTGAATNVDNRTINSIPNISRSLTDFTKFSPLANTNGPGTSFAGANNRYNQFAIDGLVNNDVFGLSSTGTNGGQVSGLNPISLDAIEEFQINIAPYDIRQGGFTGGGINAVTRSGTNKFSGSAYYFGNNQNLVGSYSPASEQKSPFGTYTDYQAGFRLGGPIIKDKLFFFVNGEITKRNTPALYGAGTPGSNITQAEADAVVSTLQSIAPNYDPGTSGALNNTVKSNKIFAKLDWNINDTHKLTLRHSYTYGESVNNGRTPNTLYLSNNGIYFPSTTNSTGLELNSSFKNKSNRLLIGYTSVVDDRDPLGSPFPQTTVNLGNSRSIVFGSEASSVANLLKQNIFTITDDFIFYKGKHTITVGTNNEFYKFYNLFVQNIYGNYGFASLANFQSQGTATPINPSSVAVNFSFDPSDDPSQSKGAADWSAFQLGVYGQDDYQINDRFRLTAGLRIDLPVFGKKPEANPAFNTDANFAGQGNTGDMPKTSPLWSPRVGFNWDVKGNKDLQVRGGSGLFTGRVPFVWMSNQFTNNGILNGAISVGTSTGAPLSGTNSTPYNIDPYSQPHAIGNAAVGRGDINIVDPNFKFPQTWRTNLAVDKRLPWGLVGTVEVIFSKTLNNINYVNLQRVPTTNFAGLDARSRYTTTSTSPTNAGYVSANRIDAAYTEVLKFTNTNKGYSYNIVAQIQKQFTNGFTASIAYNYGDSKDLNSGTSSVALSNWRFTPQVNGLNNLPLTRANYSVGSRIVAFVSYRKEYMNKMLATQLSVFYTGQSGLPFSYVYANDMNYDGTTANDLIFIPKDQSQIDLHATTVNGVTLTAADQWTALDAFISKDPYLSKHRGQYAERNGARTPFTSQFDVRLLQDFAIKAGNTTHKLQVSLDILNFANLLQKNWGKQWNVTNQTFSLISYGGMENAGTAANPDYSANQPFFTYTAAGQNGPGNAYFASDPASRWRMQIGLRYIF
jgi:hypothetical protein